MEGTEQIASSEGQELSFEKKTPPSSLPGFPSDIARRLVFNYIKPRLEKTDTHITFGEDEVYTVWYGFVLGSWKALVSTTLPDGMYYEVTYNRAKDEFYIDAYKKFDNVCVPASDLV